MSVRTSPRSTIERRPPRRRRPRLSVWRKTVWPLVRFAAVAFAVVFVGGLFANKLVRPFRLYGREHRETQQIARELETLKKENAALERRIKYAQTPEGAVLAARKLGWVKPGEITLVLPPEGQEAGGKR